MVAVHELRRQAANAAVERQRFLHDVRQFPQRVHQFALLGRRQPVAPCEQDRQHHQHDQLRRERLGGRNADFGAGLGGEGDVGFAHLRTGGDVAHRQRVREAGGFGEVVGRQGVRGLARLRDGDEQAAGRRHGLAVAELRCDLRAARNAGQLFDPVAGDAAGVVGRAAGGDGDGLGVVQHPFGVDAEGRL